jgi:hypothetical protein
LLLLLLLLGAAGRACAVVPRRQWITVHTRQQDEALEFERITTLLYSGSSNSSSARRCLLLEAVGSALWWQYIVGTHLRRLILCCPGYLIKQRLQQWRRQLRRAVDKALVDDQASSR